MIGCLLLLEVFGVVSTLIQQRVTAGLRNHLCGFKLYWLLTLALFSHLLYTFMIRCLYFHSRSMDCIEICVFQSYIEGLCFAKFLSVLDSFLFTGAVLIQAFACFGHLIPMHFLMVESFGFALQFGHKWDELHNVSWLKWYFLSWWNYKWVDSWAEKVCFPSKSSSLPFLSCFGATLTMDHLIPAGRAMANSVQWSSMVQVLVPFYWCPGALVETCIRCEAAKPWTGALMGLICYTTVLPLN